MKFKELKEILSCFDNFEISCNFDNLNKKIYCDYDDIDEISSSYSLYEKEVIFIGAIGENYLFISLM